MIDSQIYVPYANPRETALLFTDEHLLLQARARLQFIRSVLSGEADKRYSDTLVYRAWRNYIPYLTKESLQAILNVVEETSLDVSSQNWHEIWESFHVLLDYLHANLTITPPWLSDNSLILRKHRLDLISRYPVYRDRIPKANQPTDDVIKEHRMNIMFNDGDTSDIYEYIKVWPVKPDMSGKPKGV